jgi:hypothetical protein
MAERIAKQFKRLQQTGPSADWADNTRNFLMSRISRDTLGKEQPWFENFKVNTVIWLRKVSPSPVKAMSVFLVLAIIGGTSMVAKAEYIPTKSLYTVKRTFEKIELVLAVTPLSETKVHLKHAEERKNEAVKITQQTSISSEDKTEHINTVVKSLKNDINAVQTSLEIVKEDKKEPQKAVILAKEITNNINKTIEDLDEVKKNASDAKIVDVKQTVDDAQSAIEDVEEESIKVLIEEVDNQKKSKTIKDEEAKETQEAEDQDNNGEQVKADKEIDLIEKYEKEIISEDELKEIITKKIERNDKRIQEVREIVESITLESASSSVATPADIKKVSDIAEQPAKAEVKLIEAKSLIEEGQLSEAMVKVQESKQITKESKQVVEKIKETQDKATAENNEKNQQTQPAEGIKLDEVKKSDQATSSTSTETTPEIIEEAKLNSSAEPAESAGEVEAPVDEDLSLEPPDSEVKIEL